MGQDQPETELEDEVPSLVSPRSVDGRDSYLSRDPGRKSFVVSMCPWPFKAAIVVDQNLQTTYVLVHVFF